MRNSPKALLLATIASGCAHNMEIQPEATPAPIVVQQVDENRAELGNTIAELLPRDRGNTMRLCVTFDESKPNETGRLSQIGHAMLQAICPKKDRTDIWHVQGAPLATVYGSETSREKICVVAKCDGTISWEVPTD